MATVRLEPDETRAGRLLFAGPSRFSWGSRSSSTCRRAARPEIAFAGRSNAGKSSLINALDRQDATWRAPRTRRAARANSISSTSAMPAHARRHAGLRLCQGAENRGQGKWQRLLRGYLRGRPGLPRAFVLVDARHGVKSADEACSTLLDEAAVTYQLVLTKTDKTPKTAPRLRAPSPRRRRQEAPAAYPDVHATSSVNGHGHRRAARRDRSALMPRACGDDSLAFKPARTIRRSISPDRNRHDRHHPRHRRDRPHPVGGAALPAAL